MCRAGTILYWRELLPDSFVCGIEYLGFTAVHFLYWYNVKKKAWFALYLILDFFSTLNFFYLWYESWRKQRRRPSPSPRPAGICWGCLPPPPPPPPGSHSRGSRTRWSRSSPWPWWKVWRYVLYYLVEDMKIWIFFPLFLWRYVLV